MLAIKFNNKEIPNSGIICCMDSSDEGVCFIDILHDSKIRDVSGRVRINGEEIALQKHPTHPLNQPTSLTGYFLSIVNQT